MILYETHLTSNIASTHFSANQIPTPPLLMPFPTQNILYLESFPFLISGIFPWQM